MKLIKTVRLFYLFYTVYTVYILLISDYKATHALVGLAAMWLVYLLFRIGYQSIPNYNNQVFEKETNKNNEFDNEKKATLFNIRYWKISRYFVVALFNWLAVIISAKYYTGRSFFGVIAGLAGGSNAYMEYQQYFAQAGIATFSLAKIPYILLLTIETAVFYCGMVGITQSKEKITMTQKMFIASIMCSHLYFGLARGTNFETYSVFILLVYCILNRTKNDVKINYKAIGIVVILGVIMVTVYLTVVMDRGVDMEYLSLCPEIHLRPDSMLAKMFPALTGISTAIFSYLGYGIYEIGVSLFDIVFDKIACLVGILIPGGTKLITGDTLPGLLSQNINMGARWCPDLVIYVGLLGIPLFFLCVLFFGRYIHKLKYEPYSPVLVDVINILIFIELLSLPVGNFLTASTPNELFILYVIFCILKTKYSFRFFRR